jgi:hypothetical protein
MRAKRPFIAARDSRKLGRKKKSEIFCALAIAAFSANLSCFYWVFGDGLPLSLRQPQLLGTLLPHANSCFSPPVFLA